MSESDVNDFNAFSQGIAKKLVVIQFFRVRLINIFTFFYELGTLQHVVLKLVKQVC